MGTHNNLGRYNVSRRAAESESEKVVTEED